MHNRDTGLAWGCGGITESSASRVGNKQECMEREYMQEECLEEDCSRRPLLHVAPTLQHQNKPRQQYQVHSLLQPGRQHHLHTTTKGQHHQKDLHHHQHQHQGGGKPEQHQQQQQGVQDQQQHRTDACDIEPIEQVPQRHPQQQSRRTQPIAGQPQPPNSLHSLGSTPPSHSHSQKINHNRQFNRDNHNLKHQSHNHNHQLQNHHKDSTYNIHNSQPNHHNSQPNNPNYHHHHHNNNKSDDPQPSSSHQQPPPSSQSTLPTSLVDLDLEELAREKRELEERLEEASSRRRCVVCLDADYGAVFLPCMHLVTCSLCAVTLPACPVCRAPVQYLIPVSMD